jgi:hypothetical protein
MTAVVAWWAVGLVLVAVLGRLLVDRSSRPGDCPGELAAQHPRPTFWHPQVEEPANRRVAAAFDELVMAT